MNAADTPDTTRQSLRRWVIAALLLTGATAIGFLLDHHASLTSQAMVYVLAVVIASYALSWKESVFCAIGSVASFNFFFVPPRWTFEVESPENLIALSAMLLVALVISHLSAGLRRETEMAQLHAQRSHRLQELATQMANLGRSEAIVALGQAALDEAFTGPSVLATLGADDQLHSTAELAPSLADGLRRCMKDTAVLGPGTGRWPGLNAWYLPLGTKDQMFGAACVQPALANDTSGREHALALCTLIAQALWRQRLTASMLAAQGEAQRQQVQSTFLAAISHDLRTPLAAVVGAASSLQTQRDKLSPQEQDRLLASIASEAAYLSNVTENTLQLVRLGNAAQDIQRDWESMEEIVGAVLARVRQHDPARRIKSKVPDGLPLIKADPVLLAQLIANLLDNALKYSADAIELAVSSNGLALRVAVKDRGPDIPPEKYASIFEPYSRNDQSGQRGAGLGLALCRAIAQAHGGALTVRRRNGGGNSFMLSLPLEPQPTEKEAP